MSRFTRLERGRSAGVTGWQRRGAHVEPAPWRYGSHSHRSCHHWTGLRCRGRLPTHADSVSRWPSWASEFLLHALITTGRSNRSCGYTILPGGAVRGGGQARDLPVVLPGGAVEARRSRVMRSVIACGAVGALDLMRYGPARCAASPGLRDCFDRLRPPTGGGV